MTFGLGPAKTGSLETLADALGLALPLPFALSLLLSLLLLLSFAFSVFERFEDGPSATAGAACSGLAPPRVQLARFPAF